MERLIPFSLASFPPMPTAASGQPHLNENTARKGNPYSSLTPGFSIFAIAGSVLEDAGMACVPMERGCEGNEVRECSIDGMNWETREECEYGCEDGRCKEGPAEPFKYSWTFFPAIIIIIAVAGVYFLKTRKAGASPAPEGSLS